MIHLIIGCLTAHKIVDDVSVRAVSANVPCRDRSATEAVEQHFSIRVYAQHRCPKCGTQDVLKPMQVSTNEEKESVAHSSTTSAEADSASLASCARV